MTYTQAFEIAKIAHDELVARGWNFKDGVVRKAALAAAPQKSATAVCQAIEEAFSAMRVHRWDGSIA